MERRRTGTVWSVGGRMLVLLVLSVGCQGLKGSPTEPGGSGAPAASRRLFIQVSILQMFSAYGGALIQEANLAFDGRVIASQQSSRPEGDTGAVLQASLSTSPGSHHLAVTVVHQSANPGNYLFGGAGANFVSVRDDSGKELASIVLPGDGEFTNFTSGQGKSFSVEVP